ncbi:hypothetical protein WA026_011050 [Henosepilachna vigintioctopunctata]|uniref:Uncharacterized protein n=1 Tax=Henosepilachna vigintioctopunctata TaxID=420089 RepID=A0AAW1U5L0_9CUCU
MVSNGSADDAQNKNEESPTDSSLNFGRFLAHPPAGEEVCITGIAGVFPNSRDVHHFRDNLMNKIDMIDADFRRWKPIHPEVPQRTGKIYNIESFDPGFFGIHHRQANSMDPSCRLFMERAIEAILDAGMNLSELEGTNTGVFVGVCFSESERDIIFDFSNSQMFGMTGCMRSMIPNRLSYFLKLKGPSVVTDTACSSSLYALENAFTAIRTGVCDMAIVGGTNICLHPFISLQFARLGVLSLDGCCKSFDASGNGYCRSESINCILLQKAKDARRNYATIVHAKTGCDGYKEQGITYPSGEMQKHLLEEFYKECEIPPSSLSFLEAHGTGTVVGDPEEINAIDEVFSVGRQSPLLIGSVKSNIGHTEPASGLCSITKCIIAMEEAIIPPNLHYTKPREGVKALEEGRMKVVSEKTPLQDDEGLIGINSFGFGGGNCHVLLKWNTNTKVNGGEPIDDLPRLVYFSGRTPDAIKAFVQDISSRKLDAEHIQLLHEAFKKDIDCHSHRGFGIFSKTEILDSSCSWYCGIKPPLLIAFSNFGTLWKQLFKQLLFIPAFAEAMKRIQDILNRNEKGINLNHVVHNPVNPSSHTTENNILGSVVVQIGIIEVLKLLQVEPESIIGYSVGEIACGYFDGSLTLEEAILIAFEIGDHMRMISKPSLIMVVKGPVAQIQKNIPVDIEIIWRNSKDCVIVSGNMISIQMFSADLKKQGVEVDVIGANNITAPSKDIREIECSLLQNVGKIIVKSKRRGVGWIPSSTEKLASPEYFVRALQSQMTYDNFNRYILKNSVVLEIGFGEFTEIIKNITGKSLNGIKVAEDSVINGEYGIVDFLKTFGRLYEYGFNPQIQNIYPKVPYPVSRGTPMISPKIKWKHSEKYHVLVFKDTDSLKTGERIMALNLTQDEWQFASGHVIDGRTLFPATAYLKIVWDTLTAMKSLSESDTFVVFDNVRFNRATPMSRDFTDFVIMIQGVTGNFEIIEGGVDVVSGYVHNISDERKREFSDIPLPAEKKSGPIPLKTKDVYKELRLRGYNYKGAFKAIEEVNCDATIAYIKWEGNWVTFMDNMLQVKILQLDTRLLYVPTGIKKLTIDCKYHLQYVESFGENPILPVYISKDAGLIRCGGIEIRGLMASSIVRRKQRGTPVLEKYEFVPNETDMSLLDSLRVNMQIGLENLQGLKLRIVELIDEATEEGSEPLGPKIFDVYADIPMIHPNIVVITKDETELPNVTVERKDLRTENDCHLVVGSKILQRAMVMQQAFSVLKENAFILSRESLDFDPNKVEKRDLEGISIFTIHNTGTEKLVYFRKTSDRKEYTVINVSNKDENFEWLPSLQKSMKNNENIILYAQNETLNGLLGFFNCIRREPGGVNVRCVHIYGNEAPSFDPSHPFYKEQLEKNFSINIYKNGKWGTYRHLLMKDVEEVEAEHCFVNQMTRGDLSSIKWFEGPLNSETEMPKEKSLVQVYYSSVNFRDIMTASGRINADVISMDRMEQECVQGFEFSGRDNTGTRVMGMIVHGALSTLIAADSYSLVKVPECWTLEQAATVPVVYGTVIYALVEIGQIKEGQSILIHSGTGGVGQAAINYALSMNCNIFTTVGSPEKREIIKKLFPTLDDNHIGNSRDISFEQMVLRGTGGKGVDLVLNSLAEDKLLASVRCLTRGGRFLEIGKFDLARNNPLGLLALKKECSFHGIMLDNVFLAQTSMKKRINFMLKKGIVDGSVKPLSTTVFEMNEIEQAFRHMASGKHTGKVLIHIRDEEEEKIAIPPLIRRRGIPRVTCSPEKSHIIVGGLGGFGLELADWLVLRGAKNIVLTSRSGVKTGYQAYRLNIWKSYGVLVVISTADITTEAGCENIISEAEKLGPVESIFNLAVVLRDSLFEKQQPETFKISFGPKAVATMNLDKITRIRCPNLRDFVVFSSVSCGRGNSEQTNYGMSNSVMERICEQRRHAGFPAMAIQWGAVGDVGLVAEMMEDQIEMEIGGTLQQRITNCLQVMDIFLRQKEAVIVSSMLVAAKRSVGGGANNIVDAVADILGIKPQSVSPHASLSELGMDSMTAVEIKTTLEREYDVFLTAQDIRSLTFARLQEIQDSKDKDKELGRVTQRLPRGFELILRYLGDEAMSGIPIVRLPSLIEGDPEDIPYVFCFPGVEGFATTLKPLVANIKARILGVQFCYKNPTNSYKELAMESAEQMEKYVDFKEPIHMLTYSWGTIIALETMSLLEQKGYKGTITCIDGAPDMLSEMCKQEMKTGSEAEFETIILGHVMAFYLPYDIILKNREKLYKCGSFDERLQLAQKISAHDTTYSPEYQKRVALGFHTRLKELRTYEPDYPKIQSPVRLFKPSILSVQTLPDDYNLSRLCTKVAEVKIFEGNHISILENPSLAEAYNEILGFTVNSEENTLEPKLEGEELHETTINVN